MVAPEQVRNDGIPGERYLEVFLCVGEAWWNEVNNRLLITKRCSLDTDQDSDVDDVE